MHNDITINCPLHGNFKTKPLKHLQGKICNKCKRVEGNLVKKFNGSYSGEHGDGIVRSEFNEVMFGKNMNNLFGTIKKSFDPENIFNPGKIVNAPKMDSRDLFRYAPSYDAENIKTLLDWSSWTGKAGGFQGAIEMCNNNGSCRKLDGGVMCPSFRVTKDERDSTRGRANSLRLALSGQLGKDALISDEMTDTMKLCVSCKACKRECPTGVDMSKMKIELSYLKAKKYGLDMNSKLVAYLPKYAPFASKVSNLMNLRDKVPGLAKISEVLFGFTAKRPLTKWRNDYFKDNELPNTVDKAIDKIPVILFVDTFNRYHEPENVRSAIKVLNAAGFFPFIPKSKNIKKVMCCGRTYLSNGLIDNAKIEANNVIDTLLPYLSQGINVVGLEPSCILSFRDELPALLENKNTELLKNNSFTFEELLATQHKNITFKKLSEKVLLHGHCHQKSQDRMKGLTSLLSELKINNKMIDSSCCGMAGSFGYDSKNYEVSKKMANLSLIPVINNSDEADFIIANGTSCRHQISDLSHKKGKHVSELLFKIFETVN